MHENVFGCARSQQTLRPNDKQTWEGRGQDIKSGCQEEKKEGNKGRKEGRH